MISFCLKLSTHLTHQSCPSVICSLSLSNSLPPSFPLSPLALVNDAQELSTQRPQQVSPSLCSMKWPQILQTLLPPLLLSVHWVWCYFGCLRLVDTNGTGWVLAIHIWWMMTCGEFITYRTVTCCELDCRVAHLSPRSATAVHGYLLCAPWPPTLSVCAHTCLIQGARCISTALLHALFERLSLPLIRAPPKQGQVCEKEQVILLLLKYLMKTQGDKHVRTDDEMKRQGAGFVGRTHPIGRVFSQNLKNRVGPGMLLYSR